MNMKKLAILITFLFIYGCAEDLDPCENPEFNCSASVASHWELIEIYADPGNGGGSFNEVDSERTITFLTNDTFISNGSLCTMDRLSTEIVKGTVNYGDSEDQLLFNPCQEPNISISSVDFQINGDEMLVYFQCIEACIQKYKRVEL